MADLQTLEDLFEEAERLYYEAAEALSIAQDEAIKECLSETEWRREYLRGMRINGKPVLS